MFERFTEPAMRVVTLAQDEARMLDHDRLGTEHLLLGLLREGHGAAARSLASLDVSVDAVRPHVEQTPGRRGRKDPSGHIPFTPHTKKVLELSLRESVRLGEARIGTEHILLGLIREDGCTATRILVSLGADPDQVRHAVMTSIRADRAVVAGSRKESDRLAEIQALLRDIVDRLERIERRLEGHGDGT